MSMFTFAISCWPCPFTLIHWLNIPDSYQYCSLQNQTLLLPPDTSTNEHHFCFGAASSFFLELFFHSSPVAYWTHSTWELIFSPFMIFFFLLLLLFFTFSYSLWGSWSKNTAVDCHSLFQGTMFCHNSTPWPAHLAWPCMAQMAQCFIEFLKPLHHKTMIHEGVNSL